MFPQAKNGLMGLLGMFLGQRKTVKRELGN